MLDGIRTLDELALENQRVFMRVDFDVPVVDGKVTEDRRLSAALPSIKKVMAAGARVVLGSRLESLSESDRDLGLEPIGARLSELLDTEIYLPDDSVGDAARKVIQDLRPGQVCLLENLRFHPEEDSGDEGFARQLAQFTDVYVNDAPRALGRSDASIVLLPRLIRERGMGYQVAAELEAFARLRAPERPFVAVLGGSRVAHKLSLLDDLIGRADTVCVGGALANTLLAALGEKLGASRCEPQLLARGRALLSRARDSSTTVELPVDLRVAPDPNTQVSQTVAPQKVPEEQLALDIGPQTLALFQEHSRAAKAVYFHGALGFVENPVFGASTRALAAFIAEAPAFSVLSGASTLRALAGEECLQKFGFVSAGGNASLGLLSGRKLPGIEALRGGAT